MTSTEFYLVALINIVLNSYAATILTLTIIGGVLYLCMKNKISDKNDESNEDNDNVDTDENDDLEEVVTEKPATTEHQAHVTGTSTSGKVTPAITKIKKQMIPMKRQMSWIKKKVKKNSRKVRANSIKKQLPNKKKALRMLK
ncbi:uncharacterized protein [Dendropsophus ebraccatus]|uniref:uncharacterized protein isoform X3 n=1 Tax=Dendropsophus ebraccatus TaxID=150705 RepID=UPI0038317474